MSFFVPPRVDQEELLDEHDAPFDEMVRSLEDLRWFNSRAGGTRTYWRMIRWIAEGRDPATLRILDLGTGTCDLPASLPSDSRSVGIDWNLRHLQYGRERWNEPVMRVAGNAFQLPLRDSSVDIVTSSHFAHHFSPPENVEILTESLRVAKIGVAVSDTRRHRIPLNFVRLLGATGRIGEITRFDAPASVLRGYTIDEVRQFSAGVGAGRVRVRRAMPFRWVLLIWK